MPNPAFDTTQWSVVVKVASDQTTVSRKALAVLCEYYWRPLYAYVRHRGYPVEEAQDLTQAFFTRLLEKNTLAAANRNLGRFRSFLLASCNNFLADEWDKARAQKRGGDLTPIRLDFATAEDDTAFEPAHHLTPEKCYERQWALSVLDTAIVRLAEEYTTAEKSELFRHLKPTLTAGNETASYRTIAEELGLTEGALKVAAHRLRKRYRAQLREVIAQTIADEEDLDDELQHLLTALSP
jgi:RNA polymerase sigma-70 factor (ECF subfamily)